MLIRLALGNVRRSVRDFSAYFVTLAFAACLLYSFLASTDYLLALDLTTEQRMAFALAHCVFSFVLIGALGIMFGAGGILAFMGGTLALTLGILVLYYLGTVRTIEVRF